MTQKGVLGRPQSILKNVTTENKPGEGHDGHDHGHTNDNYSRSREPVAPLLLSSASLLPSSATTSAITTQTTPTLKSRKYTTLIKFVNVLTFFAWLTATTAAVITIYALSTNFWLEIIEHFDTTTTTTTTAPHNSMSNDYLPHHHHHHHHQNKMTRIIVSGLWSVCFINKHSIQKSIYFFLSAASIQLIGYLLLTIGNCCKNQKIFVFFAGIAFIKSGLIMLLGIIVYISQLKQELDGFDTSTLPLLPQLSSSSSSSSSSSASSSPSATTATATSFSFLFLVLNNNENRNSNGGASGTASGDNKLQSYRYGSSFLVYVLGFIAVELSGIIAIFLFINHNQLHLSFEKEQQKKSFNNNSGGGNGNRLSSLFPPPPPPSLLPHYHFNGCNYLNSLQNIRNQSYNSQIKGSTSSCTIHGSLKYPSQRTPTTTTYQFENQNLHRDITTNTISSSIMAEEEFSGGGGDGDAGSSTENINNSDKQTQSCASSMATLPTSSHHLIHHQQQQQHQHQHPTPKEFITFNLNNTLNRNMRFQTSGGSGVNTIARRTTPV